MAKEDIFYVNHKPRRRLVEDLGGGFVDRKVGSGAFSIPKYSTVWIKYIEDQGRQPYFLLVQRDEHIGVKDRRGVAFINELNMYGWEYMNKKIKEKRRKK